MSRERWGTFSVMDHLRPEAFVSEILLYDRLVIPVPSDENERSRWMKVGRKPDQLDAYLEIIGDLAIHVPWDKEKQEKFKTLYEEAKGISFDLKNISEGKQKNLDPLYVTRYLLAHEFLPELPRGVAKAWAIAAYPSTDEYKKDMTEKNKVEKDTIPDDRRENLSMILSHQFFTLSNSGNSNIEILKKAVELSKRDDFRENRMKFYKWQEDIIEQGITDKKAIEEMEQYLIKYNNIVKKSNHDVKLKFGFLLIKLGLSIPGILLGQVEQVISGAIEIFNFGKFERNPIIDAGDCESAAMIHDFQKKFKP